MATYYIARLKDSRLAAIYSKGSGIAANFYINGRWEGERLLLPEGPVSSCFTADFDSVGNLCIFTQNEQNDILLITHNGSEFKGQKFKGSPNLEAYPMKVYSMRTSTLVYNLPSEGEKYKLLLQNAGEGGWEEAVEIAEFSPPPAMPAYLFEFQLINPAHGLVFYSGENNMLGYREISPSKICDFIPLQRPGEIVFDYSFLTLSTGIHALYISANLFSRRLIYRHKTTSKLSEPQVLWEGPHTKNCLLSEIDGEICAFWNFGENLYIAKREGKFFGKAKIYTQKFCKNPIKASYITALTDEYYVTKTVYIDSQKPWDVQILPDIFPEFYPQPLPKEVPVPAVIPPLAPEAKDFEERLKFALKHADKLKEENLKLKEEVVRLKKSQQTEPGPAPTLRSRRP